MYTCNCCMDAMSSVAFVVVKKTIVSALMCINCVCFHNYESQLCVCVCVRVRVCVCFGDVVT